MKKIIIGLLIILIAGAVAVISYNYVYAADYNATGKSWKTQNGKVVIEFGNNVSKEWGSAFNNAVKNWDVPVFMDLKIVPGKSTDKVNCNYIPGRVEVCSGSYASDIQWLGHIVTYSDGDTITGAVIKLNENKFNKKDKNVETMRNKVICHEIGHALGLSHRYENPKVNGYSCLGSSETGIIGVKPMLADYQTLEYIYNNNKPIIGSRPLYLLNGSETPNSNTTVQDTGDGKKVTTEVIYEE